jgi:hypothetical protein
MRKAVAALLTLLFLLSPVSGAPRATHTRLSAWYRSYNTTYFGGKLLPNVDVRWADLSAAGDLGSTTCTASFDWCAIFLDSATNRAEVTTRLTLLHEMCHIKVGMSGKDPPDEHGPPFQACMMDLAKQGALNDLW